MIKKAGGQTVKDDSQLKTDVTTLKGDATTPGSVAKTVKDDIDSLIDSSTGILATAKKYTDDNSGRVIASDTKPADLKENDLWIYTMPDATA